MAIALLPRNRTGKKIDVAPTSTKPEASELFNPDSYLEAVDNLTASLRELDALHYTRIVTFDNGKTMEEIDPSKIDPEQKEVIAEEAAKLAWSTPDEFIDRQFIELLARSYDTTEDERILDKLQQIAEIDTILVKEYAELPKRIQAVQKAKTRIGIVAAGEFIGHKDIQFTARQAAQISGKD
jgi:hypothetical protein